MISLYHFLISFANIIAKSNPNDTLALANNGMHLGAQDPLDRRIISNTANYSNSIGKDPELEKNSRDMRHFLDHYKTENNPSTQEWLNIKNLAALAVGGDCDAADKLFENHITPKHLYDKLQKRCGREGANKQINGHLQVLRAQSKAGDNAAHQKLDHLMDHAVSHDLSHKPGNLVTSHQGLDRHMAGKPLSYGIQNPQAGQGLHDSFMNDANIKEDASKYLQKNNDPLINQLQALNTPFTKEAVDRLNHTRKAAEDVMKGAPGAGEHFTEVVEDNTKFVSSALGHTGMDGAIRSGLGLSNLPERPNIIHYSTHDEHEEISEPYVDYVPEPPHVEHIPEPPHAEHIPEPPHEPEIPKSQRVDDFARRIYESTVLDGAPNAIARADAKIAGELAEHYEENLAQGKGRQESINNAIRDVSNNMDISIPSKLVHSLENYDKQHGFVHEQHAPVDIEREKIKEAKQDIREEGFKLNMAADEIAKREAEVEAKAAEAEAKIRFAEDKIREANLSEEQRHFVNHIQAVEKANTPPPEKLAEMEILAGKQKRYEEAIKQSQEKGKNKPKTLKDLKELKDEYDEIQKRNKRIADENRKDREDAAHHLAEDSLIHPTIKRPIDGVNSNHPIAFEKIEAQIAEEQLANQAINKEVAEAGSISAQNVKRLGGSDEEAIHEAEKAEQIKEKMIQEEKMKNELKYMKMLTPKMGESAAAHAAEHLAIAHSGRNPTGSTQFEIKMKVDEEEMKEEEKRHDENMSQEEKFGIIKILPDNIKKISADGSSIDLPLTGLPTAKANTEEEEKIKEEMENLRDNLRNKVTTDKINSGLITMKGKDGYLNVPESCNELYITKGTVYFDQAGYNHMKSQNLDTSSLKPVFSRGPVPIHYQADVSNMKMKLPSILTGNVQKLLYNDFESINVQFATKLDINSGSINCEPWNKFSSKMRPKVYKGVNKGADEVPAFIKKEFERIENMNDGMKEAKVNVVKNPDGSLIAEIKPQYGVSSRMTLQDAMEKAAEMNKNKKEMKIPENLLNVAQQENHDFTEGFLNKVENDLRTNNGRPEVLNEKSAMSEEAKEKMRQLKRSKSPKELLKKYLRAGADEVAKTFNDMVAKSEKHGKKMGMAQEEFLESLDKLGNDTVNEMLDFYLEASASVDSGKKLAEMDKKSFASKIKESFPNNSLSDVVEMFFEEFSETLKGPNIMGKLPENQPAAYSENCSSECYNPVLKRCMANCNGQKNAMIRAKIGGNLNSPQTKRIVTKDGGIVNIPMSGEEKIKNQLAQRLTPLNICKGGQTLGCILQSQLLPGMQQQPLLNSQPILANNQQPKINNRPARQNDQQPKANNKPQMLNQSPKTVPTQNPNFNQQPKFNQPLNFRNPIQQLLMGNPSMILVPMYR